MLGSLLRSFGVKGSSLGCCLFGDMYVLQVSLWSSSWYNPPTFQNVAVIWLSKFCMCVYVCVCIAPSWTGVPFQTCARCSWERLLINRNPDQLQTLLSMNRGKPKLCCIVLSTRYVAVRVLRLGHTSSVLYRLLLVLLRISEPHWG